MSASKKILYSLVTILLLLMSFISCTSDVDSAEYDYAENGAYSDFGVGEQNLDENADYEYEDTFERGIFPDMEIAINQYVDFTSTWARSDTHFFIPNVYITHYDYNSTIVQNVLYRLPLSDISQYERIFLSGIVEITEVDGMSNFIGTRGEIQILGINQEYLFLSHMTVTPADSSELEYPYLPPHTFKYEVYSISLTTLATTFISSGTYAGVPIFHSASNSILFAHQNFDERLVRLEYFQLDSGVRSVLYEFKTINFGGGIVWWQLEDESIIFVNRVWGGDWTISSESDFILIDPEFQTQQIQPIHTFRDFEWPPQPKNLAEEFIFELQPEIHYRWRGSHVTMNTQVYYLHQEIISRPWRLISNLYRINIDGTQNTLLKEDSGIRGLLSVNDMLFATMLDENYVNSYPELHKIVKLSPDGDVIKVLGRDWECSNCGLTLKNLANTDIVMAVISSIFEGAPIWVSILYCTRTGGLFSFQDL